MLFVALTIDDKETSYWKDDCYVWYDGRHISADPDTFELLNEYWSKDKYNIFYWGERIREIDIKTFEIIDDCWGKDKNGTYYRGRKLTKRDLILEKMRNIWLEYPNLSFTELFCKITKIKNKKLINLTDDDILEHFDPINNLIKEPNSRWYKAPSSHKIKQKSRFLVIF